MAEKIIYNVEVNSQDAQTEIDEMSTSFNGAAGRADSLSNSLSRLTSVQGTLKSNSAGLVTSTANTTRELNTIQPAIVKTNTATKTLADSTWTLSGYTGQLRTGLIAVEKKIKTFADVQKEANDVINQGSLFVDGLNDSLDRNINKTERAGNLRTRLAEVDKAQINLSSKWATRAKEATDATKKANVATESLTDSVTKNGGAIAVLDSFTGGLASQFKNAYEASSLFNISLKGMRKALIATGIGALVVALGLIIAYWDDIKDAVKGVNRELEKQKALTKDINDELERRTFIGNLDLQMQKNQEEQALLNAKIRGASEKELTEIVRKGFVDRIALAEKEAKESNKVLEDAVNADEETFKKAVKAQEDAYKRLGIARGSLTIFDLEGKLPKKTTSSDSTEVDGKKEVLKEIERLNKEHFKSLLTDKDKELEAVRDKYVQLIEDAKKYGIDTVELEEELQTEINIVKAKHNKIFEDEQEIAKQEKIEADRESRLTLLDAELIEQAENFDIRRQQIQTQTDILLEDEKLTEAQKVLIRAQGAKAIKDIDKQELDDKIAMVDAIGSMFTALGNISAEATATDKALAIAGATISAGAGIASIWGNTSDVGPTPVQIATKIAGSIAIAANTAKTIKQITAVKVPSPKGGGKSVGGANIVTPNFNVVGQSRGTVDTDQAIAAQAEVRSAPLRAYVVSTDITSQQELDRGVERANTIG